MGNLVALLRNQNEPSLSMKSQEVEERVQREERTKTLDLIYVMASVGSVDSITNYNIWQNQHRAKQTEGCTSGNQSAHAEGCTPSNEDNV